MQELTTIGESHLWDTLQYLAGFVLVLCVLVFLWLMTLLIGFLFQKGWVSGRNTEAPAPDPAAAGERPIADSADPRTLAVIAAAVYSFYDEPVRVIAIQRASADWSSEGRRQIFGSHRIR